MEGWTIHATFDYDEMVRIWWVPFYPYAKGDTLLIVIHRDIFYLVVDDIIIDVAKHDICLGCTVEKVDKNAA